MKKQIRVIAAQVLAATVLLTGVPQVAYAKDTTWYKNLKVNGYTESKAASNGYRTSPNSTGVPAVKQQDSNLKKASYIPSVYQNQLSDLTIRFPGTRSQGKYNTCWAFSAIGLAEFDLITDNETADKSIDLSELQLAYFTYHNAEDPLGGTFGDSLTISSGMSDYLTLGGNLDYASRTLLQWEGVADENNVPYAIAPTTTTLADSYAFKKDVAHLQNVYIISLSKNPELVKQEIMNHGAAGIGLYVDETPIYDGSTVYGQTGETVATYYCLDSSKVPNHAVNIVGWDDNFPASGFKNQPAGNGAWLCRNSWSDETTNSINSYFWLSYYDTTLEDGAWIFDFESADNYDYNYQYDGGSLVAKPFNFKTCANVFKTKAADNELLKAVSLTMTKNANVPYTISIYTNLTNPAKPRSGMLAAKVSGTTTYAGTNTIKLNKAVSVPKGTYYSVVVTLKKSGGVDVEYGASGNGLTSRVFCDFNQSFIYSDGKWEDLADVNGAYGIGNLCIKAFSDNAGTSIGAVKNIKASKPSKNTVKLSWDKTAGAEGYEIYEAAGKNATYKKIATTTAGNYKIKKTANGTRYYKVRAYKTKGTETIYGATSSRVVVK